MIYPPASLPSPGDGVWHLGPLPLRGYALAILIAVVFAIWYGDRRWRARGGQPGAIGDIAVWVVPSGLIGARLYHVATDPQLFFTDGNSPWEILYIWQGGLGIWGAVLGGMLGGWVACRRLGVRFSAVCDTLAIPLVVAHAIGRWGNWFNQELFGGPTDLPWGLEIDAVNRPVGYAHFETFHPTFLYEFFWNLAVAGLLIWAERRFKLRMGRVFALYVMLYTPGRAWIETLRIDEANLIWGMRVNFLVCLVTFALAAAYFVIVGRKTRTLDPDSADVLIGPSHRERAALNAAEPGVDSTTGPRAADPPDKRPHDGHHGDQSSGLV